MCYNSNRIGLVRGGDKLQVSSFIPIMVVLMVLYISLRNQNVAIAKRIIANRKMEGNKEMYELAKRFIGKECIINVLGSTSQFEGIIKEVIDSAILIERDGKLEAVNLEFAIRIREYPRNKNGKKKAIVLD